MSRSCLTGPVYTGIHTYPQVYTGSSSSSNCTVDVVVYVNAHALYVRWLNDDQQLLQSSYTAAAAGS